MAFFPLRIGCIVFINMQRTYNCLKEVKQNTQTLKKYITPSQSIFPALLFCFSGAFDKSWWVLNSKLNSMTVDIVKWWNHLDILLSASVQTHLPSKTISLPLWRHDLSILLVTFAWALSCLRVFPDLYLSCVVSWQSSLVTFTHRLHTTLPFHH